MDVTGELSLDWIAAHGRRRGGSSRWSGPGDASWCTGRGDWIPIADENSTRDDGKKMKKKKQKKKKDKKKKQQRNEENPPIRDDEKTVVSCIGDKGKPVEDTRKNPPPPDDDGGEERLQDEYEDDKAAQEMDSFLHVWEQCFGDFDGLFEDNMEGEQEQEKNPPVRAEVEEEDDEVEEGLQDEDAAAQRQMNSFRRGWRDCWGNLYGSFEDNTSVRPMRYTEGPIPRYARREAVLQIFSVQVMEIKDDLDWPLHVYGWVATRDSVDRNRNLLFNRTRDNCQILTQKDPYLLLTGPSRAVLFIDPVVFEVQLRVKGKTKSEDKLLNLDVFRQHTIHYHSRGPILTERWCESKRCKLGFAFAFLPDTVEATIANVRVIDGSWPDHLRGKVVARTVSLDIGDVILLDSRDGRMPITSDGEIKLSRNVVSVEFFGELEVSLVVSRLEDNSDILVDTLVFIPQEAGKNIAVYDLDFCKVEVTIAWSLLSSVVDMHE